MYRYRFYILNGSVPSCDVGRILGHDGAVAVESIGDVVKTSRPVDRVIVSTITSCSAYKYCRKGV
jgi:alcohol dehydrogenase